MFVKPSTKRFFSEFRKLGRYGLGERLHGYVYSRWVYLYIAIGTGRSRLVKGYRPLARLFKLLFNRSSSIAGNNRQRDSLRFADTYHGKVVTLGQARQLVTLNVPVNLPNLEKVVPYRRARDIILANPDHIAVLQCPCRSSRQTPCLPLDVCLIIGEPFVSFILEHHPSKARSISSSEAVAILEQESRRGHVSHAFFKDAMLDRFYAICNCCSCCCGAMQAHRNGIDMLASSGFVASFDEALCVSCDTCVALCQFGAISSEIPGRIDSARCMGCGVCAEGCQYGALGLRRAPERGEPLEIYRLMEQAAQPAEPPVK